MSLKILTLRLQQKTTYFLQWLLLAVVIGSLVGVVCASLLAALYWATNTREHFPVIIWFLPIAGFAVGCLYYYWGQNVSKGNNQLLEEIHQPKDIIPFKMAPFIYIGTIVSHLFGASVGREGTAVQIGGAIADQFSKWLPMNKTDRKVILMMGIAAGFAGLFGTPLAGAVFALEVLVIGKIKYQALFPTFMVAVVSKTISAYCTHYLAIPHTHYTISKVPELHLTTIGFAVLAAIIFGFTSTLFSKSIGWFGKLAQTIKFPPLRPLIAGIIIAVWVYWMGTKHIGLGLDTIVASFTGNTHPYDFLIKLILTTFCLAFGFKGGEVTPLFFIGATLGAALSFIIPLPTSLLAGMGFVAVFSGATNTPIACTLMGIELFGSESAMYIGLGCVVAYLFSAHQGIYSAQLVSNSKTSL